MQPHLHHELGEKIVKEIMRPAFRRAGQAGLEKSSDQPVRLGAFFLGNWIADFSQLIDPGAWAEVTTFLADARRAYESEPGRQIFKPPRLDAGLEFDWDLGLSGAVGDIAGDLGRFVDNFPADLTWSVGKLLERYPEIDRKVGALLEGGNQSPLAQAIRDVHRFLAFVGHVPRDSPGKGMDHRVFGAVFDKFFVQYYAHEHFDRTDIKAEGSVGARNGRWDVDKHQGIYAFMRDYMEIMAGELAELDRWSRASLEPHAKTFVGSDGANHPVGDDHEQWNIMLGQLGQVLHLIEDYFAHSTFVEHAVPNIPWLDKLRRGALGRDVERRLINPETGASDPKVVTGYFDMLDTISSLEAAATTKENKDHWKHSEETRIAKAIALIQDLFHLLAYESAEASLRELIGKPGASNKLAKEYYAAERFAKGVPDKLKLQPRSKLEAVMVYVANEAVALLKKYGVTFSEADSEVATAAADLLAALAPTLAHTALVIDNRISLFSVLMLVKNFLSSPILFPLQLLAEQGVALVKDIAQYFDDKFDQLERAVLISVLGSKRPGHHSLLAKDSPAATLHESAMSLAHAVDWYVCDQLFRHYRAQHFHVARLERGDASYNKIHLMPWIDWLELLERFLAHPLDVLSVGGKLFDPAPKERWWYAGLRSDFKVEDIKTPAAYFHHLAFPMISSELDGLIERGRSRRTYWERARTEP